MSDDAAVVDGVLPATDPRAYCFWISEHVRFDDLDMLGHVNNKAFTTYIESGRAAFLRHIGLWVADEARQNVIVRLELDYLRELHYPADLRVGIRVVNIGRKSFALGGAVFNGDVCVASAVTVFVRMDRQTRSAVVLDAEERLLLQPYLSVAG